MSNTSGRPPGTGSPMADRLGRQAAYLAHLRAGIAEDGKPLAMGKACKLAGMDSSTVKTWRERYPDFRVREARAREEGFERYGAWVQSAMDEIAPTAAQVVVQMLADPDTSDAVRARLALQVLEWAGAGEETMARRGSQQYVLTNRVRELISMDGDDKPGVETG